MTHAKYHKKNGMSLAITTADRGQILIEADVSYSYKGYFYFKEPPKGIDETPELHKEFREHP